MARARRAGRSLRRTHAAQEPGVQRDGGRHPRPGHWRQHRGVQRRERSAPLQPAVPRATATRQAVGVAAQCAADHGVVPRLSGLASPGPRLRRRCVVRSIHEHDAHRWRPSRASRSRARDRKPLRHAWRRADGRSRLSSGRRRAGRAAGRTTHDGVLAAAVRIRSGRDRNDVVTRRESVSRGRCPAAHGGSWSRRRPGRRWVCSPRHRPSTGPIIPD